MKAADPVLFHYGNTVEFFIDLLAVWGLGACAIPVDPQLTAFQIDTIARTVSPRFSLWNTTPDSQVSSTLTGLGTVVAESPEWSPPGGVPDFDHRLLAGAATLDQNALILFTSGTTHQPKGVVHTHRSLQARWMSLRLCLGTAGFSRTLCLLPTHFGHGLICNCLFPWLTGHDLYITPSFKPDLLMQLGTLIDDHAITCLSSVPAMWRLALKTARPPQLRSLQRVFCGSAPLSASLWTGIQQWSGTSQVVNAYGITETASWLAGTTLPDVVPVDGLVGAVWGGTIRILRSGSTANPPGYAEECAPHERGHIWVNTPALMKGYLDREDLTTQVVSHGWFVTGDIGFLDDDGFLHLSGREREEINRGGMKIHPTDIDMVVERFEHTVDVCSFAYDDALQGEDIGIAVVLEPDTVETRRGLYEWTLQHLGSHRVPRRWYLVAEIARSARGKVNRASIAQSCAPIRPSDMRGRSAPLGDSARDRA
jgi:acyl-CoA synthetase (AMP-forming)/AMP-acid ligase II